MQDPSNPIQDLIKALESATQLVKTEPLKACEALTGVISKASELAITTPEAALPVLQEIQLTANDNLVHTALSITNPTDFESVSPILTGKMNRVSNVLNLGLYLHQHDTEVTLEGKVYTAKTCSALANEIAPEHNISQKLQELTTT